MAKAIEDVAVAVKLGLPVRGENLTYIVEKLAFVQEARK